MPSPLAGEGEEGELSYRLQPSEHPQPDLPPSGA